LTFQDELISEADCSWVVLRIGFNHGDEVVLLDLFFHALNVRWNSIEQHWGQPNQQWWSNRRSNFKSTVSWTVIIRFGLEILILETSLSS